MAPRRVPGQCRSGCPENAPRPTPGTAATPVNRPLDSPTHRVFVALASPWHLPRSRHAFDELQPLFLYARGRAAQNPAAPVATVLARLQATGVQEHRDQLPTPSNSSTHTAAKSKDSSSRQTRTRLQQTNSPGALLSCTPPVSRWLGSPFPPHAREHGGADEEIDNIIAGVALSRWHQLDAPAQPSIQIGRSLQREPDLVSIRVLDIDATSPRRIRRFTPNEAARSPRPHVRRGHWRGQRVGHHRQEIRLIWVRATTVDTTGTPANQVYTLRRPARSQSGS